MGLRSANPAHTDTDGHRRDARCERQEGEPIAVVLAAGHTSAWHSCGRRRTSVARACRRPPRPRDEMLHGGTAHLLDHTGRRRTRGDDAARRVEARCDHGRDGNHDQARQRRAQRFSELARGQDSAAREQGVLALDDRSLGYRRALAWNRVLLRHLGSSRRDSDGNGGSGRCCNLRLGRRIRVGTRPGSLRRRGLVTSILRPGRPAGRRYGSRQGWCGPDGGALARRRAGGSARGRDGASCRRRRRGRPGGGRLGCRRGLRTALLRARSRASRVLPGGVVRRRSGVPRAVIGGGRLRWGSPLTGGRRVRRPVLGTCLRRSLLPRRRRVTGTPLRGLAGRGPRGRRRLRRPRGGGDARGRTTRLGRRGRGLPGGSRPSCRGVGHTGGRRPGHALGPGIRLDALVRRARRGISGSGLRGGRAVAGGGALAGVSRAGCLADRRSCIRCGGAGLARWACRVGAGLRRDGLGARPRRRLPGSVLSGGRFLHGLLCRDRLAGRGCRSRRYRAARREERQGVDIAVRIGRDSNAEMHVALARDAVATRPDHADDVALGDDRASCHGRGAELKVRHGVAVVGSNADSEPTVRHGADERDRAARSGAHPRADRRADVDPAVLTARIRVGAQAERAYHRSVHGPSPGVGGGGPREYQRGGCREHQSAHRVTSKIVVCEPLFDGSAARRRFPIRRRTRASRMCANCVTAAIASRASRGTGGSARRP